MIVKCRECNKGALVVTNWKVITGKGSEGERFLQTMKSKKDKRKLVAEVEIGNS
jgi:hypothetical protein